MAPPEAAPQWFKDWLTSQASNPAHERIEPIVYLIFSGVIFALLLLIGISKWSPNDGQTFQVISGVLTTLLGMLAMRIKPPEAKGTTKPEDSK